MSPSLFGQIDSSSILLEECLKQLILGIVQGLTEFLPISSTAHLKVIPEILGWGDPGVSVIAALQFGSIIAVVTYFWSDLKGIFKAFSNACIRGYWTHPKSIFGTLLIIGTIPIAMAGLYIKLFWLGYQSSYFRSVTSIAIVSIFMAFLLYFAERYGSSKRNLDQINGSDALFIGLAQVLALIPGVSRSGITIAAGFLRGFNSYSSARFSFLLGVPAIALSGLVEIKEAVNTSLSGNFLPLFLGMIAAALTSWFSIDFLLRFLQTYTTMSFVVYRLFFGISLLGWVYL